MQERFNAFTVLIGKINRSIRRLKSDATKKYNLKGPHVSCLYYLYSCGPLTAKEICDICDEDKGAMSRSIDFLEKEGFIECDVSAKKRYKSRFMLTDKGVEVGRAFSDRIDEVLQESSSGVSEENRKIFYQSLNAICENLCKITEK